MANIQFSDVVRYILAKDTRYDKGAYYFVRHALDFTLKRLREDANRHAQHVCGQELLLGIKDYALDQYGPMAMTLFQQWGILKCSDFGEIVFNLVEFGVLGKTENDRREDFSAGYSLYDAFVVPYLPSNKHCARSFDYDHEDELSSAL